MTANLETTKHKHEITTWALVDSEWVPATERVPEWDGAPTGWRLDLNVGSMVWRLTGWLTDDLGLHREDRSISARNLGADMWVLTGDSGHAMTWASGIVEASQTARART